MNARNRNQLDERGMTLPLLAVSLFVMLAFAALAIDLASLRDARAEAQRAADAIALAGASAFRDFPSDLAYASDSARTRAIAVARKNKVRADTLDVRNPTVAMSGNVYVVSTQTNQVLLNVIPDSQRVRAWVRRPNVATFFGNLLGKPYGNVQAMATAWASNSAPVPRCLKPFLIPDMWYESDKSTQDKNNNNYMEPDATSNGNGNGKNGGEQWLYQPAAVGGNDYYLKYDPTVPNDPSHPQTGYGSGLRNGQGTANDLGLELLLKPQTGNNQRQGNSYFTLDGPAHNLRDDIKYSCIAASVGGTPNFSQGSATGQARQGINYLIGLDPGARWNAATKQVEGSAYQNWTTSPRVITVGVMDPKYIQGNSKNDKPDQNAVFNNFARVFLDTAPGNTDNIKAIFLGFAPGGSGGGSPTGTLVRQLQLIQ